MVTLYAAVASEEFISGALALLRVRVVDSAISTAAA